jgi:hypothetical protein
MSDVHQTQAFASRQGFTLRPLRQGDERYLVVSTGSRVPAFVGTLRECRVFILGYCWNRGAR